MVCANGVFSQMKEQKSGKIINISSSTAYWGTPNFLHYVASKAALIGMTRSLVYTIRKHDTKLSIRDLGRRDAEGELVNTYA